MDKIRFFRNLIQNFFGQFTAPSLLLFQKILEGWLLCPGTRYVTSMAYFGDPEGEHAHDAFHRFFREAKWSLKTDIPDVPLLRMFLAKSPCT